MIEHVSVNSVVWDSLAMGSWGIGGARERWRRSRASHPDEVPHGAGHVLLMLLVIVVVVVGVGWRAVCVGESCARYQIRSQLKPETQITQVRSHIYPL